MNAYLVDAPVPLGRLANQRRAMPPPRRTGLALQAPRSRDRATLAVRAHAPVVAADGISDMPASQRRGFSIHHDRPSPRAHDGSLSLSEAGELSPRVRPDLADGGVG